MERNGFHFTVKSVKSVKSVYFLLFKYIIYFRQYTLNGLTFINLQHFFQRGNETISTEINMHRCS